MTAIAAPRVDTRAAELDLASQDAGAGLRRLRLAVPDLHCGGCVASVERALAATPGVVRARANLTTRSIAVEWRPDALDADSVAEAIARAGFQSFPLDDANADAEDAAAARDLLTRLAAAGFAAANVMLLSVAVWAGAEGATRDLLHWISALIALPAVAYAGRPFFASAVAGLRAGRLNMDAPISLAVLLAAGVSLAELLLGGAEMYFDAAISLVFLLLIGRWLDRSMRAKARSAAHGLARLAPRGAWVLESDGGRRYRPVNELMIDDRIQICAGERIPADGVVESGDGALDLSLLTGEAAPVAVAPGDRVEAGALSLDGALVLRATAVGEDTTLAELRRLVAAAEDRRSTLARLADQAARIYAPAVHLIGLLTLIGWLAVGAETRDAILAATAVLIVTCPCALGLAAPMAQAVASGALFRRGLMLKDGAALERLARIGAAAFDKTGVLTMGEPRLTPPEGLSAEAAAIAAALAQSSRHPFARAIANWAVAAGVAPAAIEGVLETPGAGVGARLGERTMRLGSAAFCGVDDATLTASATWLAIDGAEPAAFRFDDATRPGAAATLDALQRDGLTTRVLSGDRRGPVATLAAALDVDWRADLRPERKLAEIEILRAEAGPVLMVGDGLNDAPALAAADVSMTPAAASDIGRAAADIVFTGRSLSAVIDAWRIARRTRAVILQNFALAAGYNVIAIPLAAFGHAGPLVAAIAMSSSSLLVTLNALRLSVGAAAAEGDAS